MANSVRIAIVAAASRLVVLFTCVLLDSLAADYDTSSRLPTLTCTGDKSGKGTTKLSGKFVWDSVFFVHLARCGYQYEQFYAFYPLLPGVLNVGAKAVQAFWQDLPVDAALGIAGLAVNTATFALSAVYLNKLSQQVLRHENSAHLATLLYCCNPATVFYTAVYTESIFACASFAGLLLLNQQAWVSTLAWCIAAATRSNGILYCGFILHKTAAVLVHQCSRSQVHRTATICMQAVVQCFVVCLPTAMLQLHGWQKFCMKPLQPRSWCLSRVPNIYSFVQSHYWGVGLFQYYKLQQVLNFLLAAPMLCLSVASCWTFLWYHWRHLLSVDSDAKLVLPSATLCHTSSHAADTGFKPARRRQAANIGTQAPGAQAPNVPDIMEEQGFLSSRVAPYIVHLGFLTATAALAMNVQVATRFLSACPAVYWYAASLQRRPHVKLIWAWFLSYFVLGITLFPNFYPWT